jgi:hypothetical protein
MKKYIIVLSVLVLLGLLFLVLQNKENKEIIVPAVEQQNTESEENIAPVTREQKNTEEVKETSLDSDKKGLEVFESAKLGIRFYYPKNIDLSFSGNNSIAPVLVSEEGNTLSVSAFGNKYYAEIYRKESNESFEESILRQFVKEEYRNTVCFVEKQDARWGKNVYLLTFEGDNGDAGGWTELGNKNSEKCGGYSSQLRIFYADEKIGGFYRATRGAQEPSFGDPNSYTWWPENIEFIR